jgi:hypothetical protein
MPDRALTNAEYQRRFRRRAREKARVMRGDLPKDVVDALIRAGFLGPDEARDPDKIGEAVSDLCDCWSRGTLRPPP